MQELINKIESITEARRRFYDELIIRSDTFRVILKLLYILEIYIEGEILIVNYNYKKYYFKITDDLKLEYIDKTPEIQERRILQR